ncbi:putative U-box domain-containing protein 50 isoform X2 [Rutidosis leptorrhynchoides]|uniref:putative U-box domain-containing protein 50 isoform X2 n=1 Tax=Rutidosis leptorrhynchoides TaxID=125765 RepID=UPI003A9A3E95
MDEKVYVAIGNDVQEGLATLEWTLRKWSSTQISIVILHAYINTNYVYTYYGRLPASYVNDESVDFLKKYEQEKVNKILNQYTAFCGKVKTETLSIEKFDEATHKRVLHLITDLRINKLVMGVASLKTSKFGGRLIFLKEENNEGFIEDDQGDMIVKMKKRGSVKGWFDKMFPDQSKTPRTSSNSADSPRIWENSVEEIKQYFNQLLNSDVDEEIEPVQSSTEPVIPQDLTPIQKIEFLRIKIGEARETILLKRREAKESAIRYSKAEWVINLCNSRAADFEARLNEETTKRGEFEKDLNIITKELNENKSIYDQNKSRLDSTLEIQRELSNKLKSLTQTKSQYEEKLSKMIRKRGGMIQEIETLRKQKDVMKRRIEFCRDKDAIEMVTRLNVLSFSYKEFSVAEIRSGTENFSEKFRIKCSGDFTNVYKARINHTTVAVKLYVLVSEDFDSKVTILSRVHHPHLVAMLGFCKELKCIVFEYMDQNCLRNAMFSNSTKEQDLNWHAKICIAAEVCSGLTFLHLTKPRPMVHGNLNLANILLDSNNVAKLHGFRLDYLYNESDIRSDIQGFGNLVLQLLSERTWSESDVTLVDVLAHLVGEWPVQVATEFARIAIRCVSIHSDEGAYTGMNLVMKDMEDVRKQADEVCSTKADVGCSTNMLKLESDDETIIPSFFYCPILQDIMKDPYLASDGFSYELGSIKKWLDMGHNTSPMTNLVLQHKHLTPNYALRSLIQDWHNKRSIPLK